MSHCGISVTLISGKRKSSLLGCSANIASSLIVSIERIFLKNLTSAYSTWLSISIALIASDTSCNCSVSVNAIELSSLRYDCKNVPPCSLISEIHELMSFSKSILWKILSLVHKFLTKFTSSVAMSPSQAMQQKMVFKYNSSFVITVIN